MGHKQDAWQQAGKASRMPRLSAARRVAGSRQTRVGEIQYLHYLDVNRLLHYFLRILAATDERTDGAVLLQSKQIVSRKAAQATDSYRVNSKEACALFGGHVKRRELGGFACLYCGISISLEFVPDNFISLSGFCYACGNLKKPLCNRR
jgi:hypothetical protein